MGFDLERVGLDDVVDVDSFVLLWVIEVVKLDGEGEVVEQAKGMDESKALPDLRRGELVGVGEVVRLDIVNVVEVLEPGGIPGVVPDAFAGGFLVDFGDQLGEGSECRGELQLCEGLTLHLNMIIDISPYLESRFEVGVDILCALQDLLVLRGVLVDLLNEVHVVLLEILLEDP